MSEYLDVPVKLSSNRKLSANGKHCLVVTRRAPLPTGCGFSVRLERIASAMARAGWTQHLLVVGNLEVSSENSRLFETIEQVEDRPGALTSLTRRVGRRVCKPLFDEWPARAPGVEAAVSRIARRVPLDACLVHTPELAHAFTGLPAGVLRVLDSHDIWSQKYAQFSRRGLGAAMSHYRSFQRELDTYLRADQTIAISTADRDVLREAGYPEEKLIYTPVSMEPRAVSVDGRAHDILFVGSGGFPNQDAVEFFTREVLPRVRRAVPDARLLMSGASAAVRDRFENDDRVVCLPFMEDVDDIYRLAQVVVVPLRVGTGLKIKALESFSRGRATIVSETGARGLELDGYPQRSYSEEPESFAAEVLRALTDRAYSAALAEAGTRIVCERYSDERVHRSLLDALSRESRPDRANAEASRLTPA